ncbi:3-hydroxyisobutyryl-CoA hydrolase-like protein 5 isoform X1 [Pyrus x bretschneideri]|uniref:3-hydroxyisobutyryl-CoA hydrolase-like protein 5 isoform X1 n=1 Tax=Pyrus x bretschneideri TaxID=225117 RepID=UPI00202FD0E8|nr:3-hydroxyisobutyryl-CoA hydrolase-like protein 5 isoform X1 [Pyrus x bretschneideri]
MYWLCYHIHTYKKTQVALVHGISMGGGRSLMVPMKFSVLTEKTLREFLALTGARLNGKELVAAGQATHFFPLEKISDLEKRLISLNSGNENAVKAVIEEFSVAVKPDEESVLNKKSVIDGCFSKDTVAEIIQSLEAEANKEGNGWIGPVLKGLKRSSPTGLRITLRSIREGRKQTLSESLTKEFGFTINILRSTISEDVYEGIRALTIDKDNAPKWNPLSLDNVGDEKVDLVFQPFAEDLELEIKEGKANRWDGKYENAAYASFKVTEKQDTFLVRVQG